MPIVDLVFTKNKKLVDKGVSLAFKRLIDAWCKDLEEQKKIGKQVFKDWVKEFNVSSKKLTKYPYFKDIIPIASPDERKLYGLHLKIRKTEKDKREFESIKRKIRAVDEVAKLDDYGSMKMDFLGWEMYMKIPINEAILGKSKVWKKYLQIDKIDKFMKWKAKEVANGDGDLENRIYFELLEHLDKQCVKYDSTLEKATFRTWSDRVIRNKLASIIKKNKRPFVRSIDLDNESGEKDYIPRIRKTTGIQKIEIKIDLEQLGKKLTKAQKEVIEKWEVDMTQEQMANKLKISQSALRDRLIGIRKKYTT